MQALASYSRCLELVPDSRNAGQNRLLALNYIHSGEPLPFHIHHCFLIAIYQRGGTGPFARHALSRLSFSNLTMPFINHHKKAWQQKLSCLSANCDCVVFPSFLLISFLSLFSLFTCNFFFPPLLYSSLLFSSPFLSFPCIGFISGIHVQVAHGKLRLHLLVCKHAYKYLLVRLCKHAMYVNM